MRPVHFIILVSLAALGAGCAKSINTAPPSAQAKTAAQVAPQELRTRVSLYECPSYGDIVVHYNFGEVTLILKDETFVLPQAPAASGTKYSDKGNMFWEKTPEAMVILDGKPQEMCRSNSERASWVDAWRRGVSFRAQGTDPAWWVDILDGDHITLGLEDGDNIVHAPADPPKPENGSRVYQSDSDSGKLTVTITPGACRIGNSATEYPDMVTVKLRDATYSGCGTPADRQELSRSK